MWDKIFNKLDGICCAYLGLDQKKIRPNTVELVNNQLMITVAESYKRTLYTMDWEKFSQCDLKNITESDKEKLGLAIGKTIADNLIVSFEETTIRNKE